MDDAGTGVQWAYRHASGAELRIPVGVGADGKGGVVYRAPRNVFERVLYQGDVNNWLPGQKVAPTWLGRASDFAARHADTLKWGARIGGGLAFAVSAYDQWQEDSLRPDLSNGQRVLRAGVTGTLNSRWGILVCLVGCDSGCGCWCARWANRRCDRRHYWRRSRRGRRSLRR